MSQPKTIQMPMTFFYDVIDYLNNSEATTEHAEALRARIDKAMTDKADAMAKRDLYSKYKSNTLSEADKEKARQEYLDLIGISPSFRW